MEKLVYFLPILCLCSTTAYVLYIVMFNLSMCTLNFFCNYIYVIEHKMHDYCIRNGLAL